MDDDAGRFEYLIQSPKSCNNLMKKTEVKQKKVEITFSYNLLYYFFVPIVINADWPFEPTNTTIFPFTSKLS